MKNLLARFRRKPAPLPVAPRDDSSSYFATQFQEASQDTQLMVSWDSRSLDLNTKPYDPALGTLHTSSAAKTIDRVVDVFPAAEKEMVRAMLSESLVAVISQTLCKLKDGSGRVAAHEIMIATSAIKNLIRENKIAQMYSSIQTGQTVGMQTLDQCLADLVRRNVVAPVEARQKAKFPENFPG